MVAVTLAAFIAVEGNEENEESVMSSVRKFFEIQFKTVFFVLLSD